MPLFHNPRSVDPNSKYPLLVTHFSIIILIITSAFWLLNIIYLAQVPYAIFLGFMSIGVITFTLNKTGYKRIAKLFGLMAINLAVYSVASSESSETGMHLFLGAAAFAALVIYGYNEWYFGVAFMIFSLTLYFGCFFSDYSPLPERTFNQDEINVFFIVNSTCYAAISCYLFYLVLFTNHRNEQVLRENEMRINLQNEQLKKTNTELDRFVYSASHDLRAPLSSMSGLIAISEASQDLREVKDYLGMMKGRIKVLDKFITDIIHYSRNTRLELVHEKMELWKIINEISDGLQFAEGAEHISIINSVDQKMQISTDPTRIRMVLNNLISNAIRYYDKNKSNCMVRVESKLKEGNLLITIEDNGIGIPNEHQKKIFEMFYKATENSSGSGLGLYIANEAITKLGGTLEVISEVGKGSTFSIMLPNCVS